jgi:hypothetical protein
LHATIRGYFFLDFLDEDLLRGTLPPSRRACESPIAIACLRLFTFLPDRPLFKVPVFRSRIVRFTFCDAFFPYLAIVALLLGLLPEKPSRQMPVSHRCLGCPRATVSPKVQSITFFFRNN